MDTETFHEEAELLKEKAKKLQVELDNYISKNLSFKELSSDLQELITNVQNSFLIKKLKGEVKIGSRIYTAQDWILREVTNWLYILTNEKFTDVDDIYEGWSDVVHFDEEECFDWIRFEGMLDICDSESDEKTKDIFYIIRGGIIAVNDEIQAEIKKVLLK